MQATETEQYRNSAMTINADATKHLYTYLFGKYSDFVKGNVMPKNPNANTKLLEAQIIDFVLSLKSTNETKKNYLKAIYHFYTMNDIVLNKLKISKFVKTNQIAVRKNQGYSREQIKKMFVPGLSYCYLLLVV